MDVRDQKTLVLIKPDGVARKLVGEIISRFERVGLVIEEMRLVRVDEGLAYKHYADDQNWQKSVGDRLLGFFKENSRNPIEDIGTDDPVEIGKKVREWLAAYLVKGGPVVAMVLRGPHAIEIVRKLAGATYPLNAAPGTIRGDYGYESPFLANVEHRAIENMIHASGAPDEAEREIELWFSIE